MTYGFLANVPADIEITARGGRVQLTLAGVPVKFPPTIAYAIADEIVAAAETAEGRSENEEGERDGDLRKPAQQVIRGSR